MEASYISLTSAASGEKLVSLYQLRRGKKEKGGDLHDILWMSIVVNK